ncbi:unnamed protein product [Cuscuta epithymum]|uniref:Integrase catalytic domain-containing protein n=1 Tax=Cuscuta epithymum TaxID=186058 RepID=A0AAV0FXW5_9ASTE|nr:unnamed protein product [Cuscuta epithymum]
MPIGVGERRGGVYYFRSLDQEHAYTLAASDSGDLWHSRLGHPSVKVLRSIDCLNTTLFKCLPNKTCDACLRGKQTRDIFPISSARAVQPFELIHCDIWGPYSIPASCGARYFLTIVDDYSRAVWVHLMKEKSEVKNILKQFFAMTSRQFNKMVKVVRSDNGKEFHSLKDYYLDHGIIFQTSCVYTPQQNGRVERKHRHVLEVARTLRFHANLPIEFWGECVLTAGYLINRLPSPVIDNKSPYALLYNKAPLYDHLRVFGCLCYAHNKIVSGDKFAPRGVRCVFLGYAYAQKGWKVFDLDNRRHFVSRDVRFIESKFPFANEDKVTDTATLGKSSELNNDNATKELEHYLRFSQLDDSSSMHAATTTRQQIHSQAGSRNPPHEHMQPPEEIHASNHNTVDHTHSTADTTEIGPTATGSTQLLAGRGLRQRKAPIWHQDYEVQLNTVKINSLSVAHPSSSVDSGNPYSISHYVNYNRFSVSHRAFLAAISAHKEPSSFQEAVRHPEWRAAMKREIDALERTGTWEIQALPPGKRAIYCKWVFKIKYKCDGSIDRYKARLVVCGNRQVQGIDYTETFAPVAKMVTVRTILAVASSRHWELHQMDVDNAFLHGDLHEEVYMHLPPGYSSSTPGKVCRLLRSLYGLRQAPRCWFSKLTSFLRAYGFCQSHADYSLFTLRRDSHILCVLVYVDDLLITGNDHGMIIEFKSYLARSFPVKDLGLMKYFLGIEVARNPTDIGGWLGSSFILR